MPFSMPSSLGMRSLSPDLAFSMWRRGRHAKGGIHKPERPSRSQPARQCDSTQARPSKIPSQSTDSEDGSPEEDCTTKEIREAEVNFSLDALWRLFLGNSAFAQASEKNRFESHMVDGGIQI